MGIGIVRYYAYDNTTNYQEYWVGAASPPPKNTTNVTGCGCYIVKRKDESERVWVTYITYYTYHCLNLSKKKDWKFSKKLRQRLSVEQEFITTLARDMWRCWLNNPQRCFS